jgi:hypothetical protein
MNSHPDEHERRINDSSAQVRHNGWSGTRHPRTREKWRRFHPVMSVFPGVDKQTDRRVDADECVMNVTSAALPQVLETALVQYELLAFLSARAANHG